MDLNHLKIRAEIRELQQCTLVIMSTLCCCRQPKPLFVDLAPVVQRADNWISRYPAEQIYSNQCFWQVFHTIPFLNLTYASTLFTNYRIIVKILHTFYLPDSKLSSGYNYPPFEQLGPDNQEIGLNAI